MKPEDELIDALLKEQARHRDADEELLSSIAKALDGQGGAQARKPSKWRRLLPLSIAAGLAIGGAVIHRQLDDASPKEAIGKGPVPDERTTTGVPAESGELALETMAAPVDAAEAPAEPRARTLMVREVEAEPIPTAEAGMPVEESPAPAPPLQKAERQSQPMPAMDSAALAGSDEELSAPPAGEAGRGTAKTGIIGRPSTARMALRRDVLPAPRPEPFDGGGFVFPEGDAAPAPTVLSRENYGRLIDQPWKSPWQEALSTFSIDVDTASYTNLRRTIREGRPIQPDAVRIEEMINYFDYRYPQPEGDSPFAVGSLLATCPWQPEHLLARIAIKGREIETNARPPSNLVFLIDVSGSMQSPDKLPMLKRAMTTLIGSLDERDRVGIVVYAGTEGVVLSPTELNEEGKSTALRAIGKLESGGSTNGGAGISRAYQMALANRIDAGVNRVILASDGDFNVGTTGQGQLVELVKGHAAKGVSLSVLGFGTGNLNDAMLEAITNDGNGNYFYVDGDREAERIFLQKLSGTLVTIAKDVKIQVEFNPGKVKAYRLIGYANRVLREQDFNDDRVDAGDIGAGHTVTAFYEIVPVGAEGPGVGEVDELKYQRPADRRELVESNEWFTLKLRHKHPEGEKSRLIQVPVTGAPLAWQEAGGDFRMAAAVALAGMKLRGIDEVAETGWEKVAEIAGPALADDPDGLRAEFLGLLQELH